MADPIMIDGWRCTEKDHGLRIAEQGSDSFEWDGEELYVTDSTRYYPGGSYRITKAVLEWLIGQPITVRGQ